MQNPSIVARQSCQFAILVIFCGDGDKRRSKRTTRNPRNIFPELDKTFHPRHGPKTGISGEDLIPTQSGERNLYPCSSGFPRNEESINSIHRGQVHRLYRMMKPSQHVPLSVENLVMIVAA